MKKALRLSLAIILLFSLIIVSCQKDDPASPTTLCNQECQDENSAYGLISMFWFIWNQNIAGQPAGNKDLTVNGPQGGTVHITGTTAVANNGINTVHLVFDMTSCKSSNEYYNLTFSGVMNADGTFSSSHKAMAYNGVQLTYTGTVGKNINAPVSGTCQFIVNESISGVSGSVCGRQFSYSK